MVSQFLGKINLDLSGMLALADLNLVAERTAIAGTSCLKNALILCPGMHREQAAVDLHKGEYPAAAALTTGYVFRVENQATVYYLQRISTTGHLTTVEIKKPRNGESGDRLLCWVLYDVIAHLTMLSLSWLGFRRDWWGVGTILLLMFSRLLNCITIRRRSKPGWKGASEPGVQGDLLVLLGQDKWIRMQGLVDDLKMVTSGQWLRDPLFAEHSLEKLGTLLVYLAVVVASNAGRESKVLLMLLLLISTALLACSNTMTQSLHMHGCLLAKKGDAIKYARRRDLADQLINETGREDWAIRLGMVVASGGTESQSQSQSRGEFNETVTM